MKISRSFPIALAAFLGISGVMKAHAAPHVPDNDNVVLERLPARAADSATKTGRALRERLAARPDDPEIAAELAQHYYRLAQREGDPRYVGYAQAVLDRWPPPADAPTSILLVRALLAQFVHDFAGAGRDLTRILDREPDNLAARSYRAILRLVQAQYDGAREDCRDLAKKASGLVISACEPTVQAVVGEAAPAYDRLLRALASTPDAPGNERFWVLTRLGEVAHRLGRNREAEAHFRAALGMGITDQYLLATYAEFLLDGGRPREVVDLLREMTRNDVLLLRLALAEQEMGATEMNDHVATLGARIDAARRRGDELHLGDEAIFELRFQQQPAAAVKLARRNWDSGQREPSDARILLEAAAAAKDPGAAAPVLEWLRATRHEDRRLQSLARQVEDTR